MLRYITMIFASLWSLGAVADHRQHDMRVDGLTCPFCVATSSYVIGQIEGVSEVVANLEAGVVSVCAEGEVDLSDERMAELFRKNGFTYRSQTVTEGCTIKEIVHSDTDETLTGHTHPHPLPEDGNTDHQSENINPEHSGQGS